MNIFYNDFNCFYRFIDKLYDVYAFKIWICLMKIKSKKIMFSSYKIEMINVTYEYFITHNKYITK